MICNQCWKHISLRYPYVGVEPHKLPRYWKILTCHDPFLQPIVTRSSLELGFQPTLSIMNWPHSTPLAPMLLWAPHFHEPWPQEIKSRMKEGIMLVAKFDQFWMEIRSLTETNLYQYGFMIKVDPSALRFDLNICHEAIGCYKSGRCTVAKQKTVAVYVII